MKGKQPPDLNAIRFDSLRCSKCREYFEPSLTSPKAPQTTKCGLLICKQCLTTANQPEEQKKKKKKKTPISPPAPRLVCLNRFCGRTKCYEKLQPARDFVLILQAINSNGRNIQSFIKYPKDQIDQIKQLMECEICSEPYSCSENLRKPLCLHCGHMICRSCYLRVGRTNQTLPRIQCPFCRQVSNFAIQEQNNQLTAFLQEFAQLEARAREKSSRHCSKCGDEAMPQAFMDSAVRILLLNKLLDERNYYLIREIAATGIRMLMGAFLFGKKGAFAGVLMSAFIIYELVPNYKKLLARVKALSDDDKDTLANILQVQCASKNLEEFAKFSEDEDNARDIFATIEEFLRFKNA